MTELKSPTTDIMKIIRATILMFVAAFTICAQDVQIDESEFDTVVAEGKARLENRLKPGGYRVTSNFTATLGRATNALVSIADTYERARDGSARSIRVEGAPGSPRKTEMLLVKSSGYIREGVGTWTRHALTVLNPMVRPAFGSEADGAAKKLISLDTQYYYLGDRGLEAEELKAYASVEIKKMVYEINGNDYETRTTNTYYFRRDGSLARHDLISTGASQRNGARSEYRFTVKWDIDPMIVVNAPANVP